MDKKKVELNIEELEERIAPSVPKCITVVAGVGPDFTSCSPGDSMPPPHMVIELPDGSIIQPTQ